MNDECQHGGFGSDGGCHYCQRDELQGTMELIEDYCNKEPRSSSDEEVLKIIERRKPK